MKNKRHKTSIYLTDEMLHILQTLAERNNRSLNGEMLQAIKLYIDIPPNIHCLPKPDNSPSEEERTHHAATSTY